MTASTAPLLVEPPHCVWEAGAELGEGTCWSERDQVLWWVDILGHRLHRYGPATGERRSWGFSETISAVAERASGAGLIVALQRGFALFDPATGALRRLQVPEPDRPGNRFNDGKCDARGRFWAGTMDFAGKARTGALWCYAAHAGATDADAERDPEAFGRCERALDAAFAVTNGPAWSRDARTMWFNDTVSGAVHAYEFDLERGAVGARRDFLQFAPADGHPDGMTTDAEGRLWIARWGAACVTCHDPSSGHELLRVPLPAAHVTNVAFGGADLDTLYVTTARSGLDDAQRAAQPLAGGLFAARTSARGIAGHRFAG